MSLKTKTSMLVAIVMTMVKYDSEVWVLRKANEDLLDVLKRNCLQIFICTRLTDRISNSRLYEKCCSVPLSRAIMRERFRWLGHVLWRKDDRLPKDCPFWPILQGQTECRSSAVGVGECRKDRFKENGNFLGGYKEGGL